MVCKPWTETVFETHRCQCTAYFKKKTQLYPKLPSVFLRFSLILPQLLITFPRHREMLTLVKVK